MANKEQEQASTDDALLQMLMDLVEEDGVEISVTLTVNGAVISGELIGAGSYYDGIIESSKESQDNTLSKIITKKFTDLKEGYKKQKKEDEENDGTKPTFIHLKNAKYFSNDNKQPPSSMTWWRGKISSVDAISFNHFA